MEWVAIIISLVGVGVAVWAAISSSESAQKQITEVQHFSVKNSENAQKQISTIMELMDVFMAANAPQILEAKHKYEQELTKVNEAIKEKEKDLQIVRHPFGHGSRIDAIEELEQNRETQSELDNLVREKDRLEEMINVLQEFLNKKK